MGAAEASGRLSTPKMAAKSDRLYAPAFLAAVVLWYLPMCLPLALTACGFASGTSGMAMTGAGVAPAVAVGAAMLLLVSVVEEGALSRFFFFPFLLRDVPLGPAEAEVVATGT